MTVYTPYDVYNQMQTAAGPSFTDRLKVPVTGYLIGIAIVGAESGYDSTAVNVNGPNSTAPGSRDRGWWQFNDKWHSEISDAVAFDPKLSTQEAFRVSNGFTDWSAWRGSNGLDPTSAEYQTAKAAFDDMMGYVVDDTPILSQIDPDANGIPNVGDLLPDGLQKLLQTITSLVFWKRIGLGALGVVLVIAALVLLFGKDVVESVKP